jgi:hypothetical protein
MTGICKDDDRETTESSSSAAPFHVSNIASICHCVSFSKMIGDEDDEVSNRDQCNDAGILERVEFAQEGKRYDYEPNHLKFSNPISTAQQRQDLLLHEGRYPKMPIN